MKNSYWEEFKGSGSIFEYLKYKGQDIECSEEIAVSKENENGVAYGAISEFNGNGINSTTHGRI